MAEDGWTQGVCPEEPGFARLLINSVANMASYAISSSLILVIHDNMIIGTNHIVQHLFIGISRSQGCKKNICQNAKTKGQNRARKGK
jgi:hypothetical protein